MTLHRAIGSTALRRGLILAAAFLFALEAYPAVWYVNMNAEPGGDGTSWATALQTIEPAVNAAGDDGGGEVWVAQGRYFLQDNPAEATGGIVLPTGVELYGGFRGDEEVRGERDHEQFHTIVDLSDLPRTRFKSTGFRLRAHSVLDGVILCNGELGLSAGQSSTVKHCTFEYLGQGILGGDYVTVDHCTFRFNDMAEWGRDDDFDASGIAVQYAHGIKITNSTFQENSNRALNIHSGTTVSGCRFLGNTGTLGGAIKIRGVGNRIENSLFSSNRAWAGGGIYFFGSSDEPPRPPVEPHLVVSNCVFERNEAMVPDDGSLPGLGGHGGAILTRLLAYPGFPLGEGEGDYTNSESNSYVEGEYEGAVTQSSRWHVRCLYGAPCPYDVHYVPTIVINSTFYGNSAERAGGAMSTGNIWPVVVNSIYWNNGPESLYVASPEPYHGIDIADYPSFSYCILPEFPGGVGSDNLFVDPRFADPENGDFRLMRDSPAIDAGRDVSDPLYGAAVTDFLGRARGFPYASSPGGDGSYYDIGAFEFHPGWHAGDIDGSGSLSLSELLRIIQIFSMGGYHCDPNGEDGFAPGPAPAARDCDPHSSDYNPQDWRIDLTELLRAVQFFNVGGYHACPDAATEDGYCAGAQ